MRDVSERTKIEQELKSSNRDKELLLREMQHRIKNTLAVISGFLSLEMDKCRDKETRSVFLDSIARIRTVSRVYQSLYQTKALDNINVSLYIREMAQQLMDFYAFDPGLVELELRLEEISLDMKRAMNVGLILNELLTNALKYAFAPGTRGTIRIALDRSDTNIALMVSDDGKGLSESAIGGAAQGDSPHGTLNETGTGRHKGIGLHIVDMLANELGGSFSIESRGGMKARLVFPNPASV